LKINNTYHLISNIIVVFLLISQLGLDSLLVYPTANNSQYAAVELVVEINQEVESTDSEIEDQIPSNIIIQHHKHISRNNQVEYTLVDFFLAPPQIKTPPPQADLQSI
jgi:hypothetical protein